MNVVVVVVRSYSGSMIEIPLGAVGCCKSISIPSMMTDVMLNYIQTELMAAERGFSVDSEGFKALMENDRLISKADTQVLTVSSSCLYRERMI